MRTTMGTVRIEGGVLAEMYARYAPEALRLAYLLTGDATLAEDLAHDAFVRVAGRLLHLRDPAGFQAYLRTTILNLARSHFRRRAVERKFAERQSGPRPVAPADLSDRDEMRTALLTLPVRQRTAIVLRYYEDLSEEQTARVMRCRPQAVKSLVSRAMTSLRRSIGDA
ncbi:MAG TPA: SigE family RNA polymerase sigma factor [Actinomycetota bacterium]|nr:SigE family RNA polymerase sigma factor [Actinomycetota bacterium]